MQLAKEVGLTKIVLESDCMGVVVKLNSKELDRSVHGQLIKDIKVLLGDFEESSVSHVRRTGNEVAHRLTKDGGWLRK
jgi:ribosome recycling factor